MNDFFPALAGLMVIAAIFMVVSIIMLATGH